MSNLSLYSSKALVFLSKSFSNLLNWSCYYTGFMGEYEIDFGGVLTSYSLN